MDTARLKTIGQVRKFLSGTSALELRAPLDNGQRRQFVAQTLCRLGYSQRPRGERGLLWAYLQRVSDYSRASFV